MKTSWENIQVRDVGATVRQGSWDGEGIDLRNNWKARQKADTTL